MKNITSPQAAFIPENVAKNRETFESIAELFRVFGDATRLQILQALQDGEKNVGEIVAMLATTQANVSKHLKLLYDARIVTREQRGTASYYRIDDNIVHPLCDLICDKLDRDQQAIASRSREAR